MGPGEEAIDPMSANGIEQTGAQADQRQLAQWLREWEVFRRLEPASSTEPIHVRSERCATRRGVQPEPGEIWLLPPSLTPDGPRYVAVFGPPKDGYCVVIPFGLLSVPATPKELGLSRDYPLAVLCLWNQTSIEAEQLAAGWHVGALTDEERSAIATIDPDTRDSESRVRAGMCTGVPVRHPLDPRLEYMDVEREFAEHIARSEDAEDTPTLIYEVHQPEELSLAAEEREAYGGTRKHPRPDDNPPDSSPRGQRPGK